MRASDSILRRTGGTTGAGHINCRPISHWLDLFASAGWYPCLFDSLVLRSLSTFPWFHGNLVVLTRDGHGAAVARERLMELEQQEIKWNKQRPAVITHSFTETATKLLADADSRTVAVANALLDVSTGKRCRHRKPQELRRRGQFDLRPTDN